MHYEELHSRYGMYVSQRLRLELTPSEFDSLDIDNLSKWLETRAEAAHEEYLRLLGNPFAQDDMNRTGEACRCWRQAEDLAYLVAIAEDVSAAARAV